MAHASLRVAACESKLPASAGASRRLIFPPVGDVGDGFIIFRGGHEEKQSLCERPLAFRATDTDIAEVDKVCERLDLERSEVLRRAVHEGLRTFQDARLPEVAE